MTGEIPEEWRNIIFMLLYKKAVNKIWEVIVYLMCFVTIYILKFSIKNWKHKQNSSFWFAKMESEGVDSALMHNLQCKYS
jgi:hypothetical protein